MPIPGVTGQLISDAAIQSGHKNARYIENNENIISAIEEVIQPGDIVITLGAGTIYKFGEELIKKNS